MTKEYKRGIIHTMIDDSEIKAINGAFTIAEYNEIFWMLHELNKTGHTATISENIRKYFESYKLKAQAKGIGWTISWT